MSSTRRCTGANGKNGKDGYSGVDGLPGEDGEEGPKGDTIILSERAKRGLDISPVPVNTDGLDGDAVERVGRGSYLVNAVAGCNDCHQAIDPAHPENPPMFLGGGARFGAGPGVTVYVRNLTPDTETGMQLSEDEFIEAFRTGRDFKNEGESLIVMPWPVFRWMSTEDIRSIYAYLRAIPPVTNPVPNDIKGPLAAIPPSDAPTTFNEGDVERPLPSEDAPDPEHVLKGLAIQPLADAPVGGDPALESDFGRGSYLVNAAAQCNDCHTYPARDNTPGPTYLKVNTAGYLSGGQAFISPEGLDMLTGISRTMSANLTGETKGIKYSFSTFLQTRPTATHAANPSHGHLGFPMPWATFRNMTLDDLRAIYTYIRNVPGRTGADDAVRQGHAVFCASDDDCDQGAGETCAMETSECVGAECVSDSDCGACQTCTASVCTAPAEDNVCLLTAF